MECGAESHIFKRHECECCEKREESMLNGRLKGRVLDNHRELRIGVVDVKNHGARGMNQALALKIILTGRLL